MQLLARDKNIYKLKCNSKVEVDKYLPTALDCGLFQVYIASRKYALEEEEEEITVQTTLCY